MNLSKIKAFRSLAGITLFMVGVVIVRRAAKYDVEILRVLFNSSKFRRRYDPMK
jgi:type IV secretory pathway TrbD component